MGLALFVQMFGTRELTLANLVAKCAHRITYDRIQICVGFDKLQCVVACHSQQIVGDQHLTVAGRSGANAYRRDRYGLGNLPRDPG